VAAAAVLGAVLLLSACGRSTDSPARLFRMGERVQVGPLIYIVLDTEWKTQVGDGAEARSAKNRFLLLQLTVTNSGGKEIHVPSLTVEDSRGNSFPEDTGGGSIHDWLGLLRKVGAGETLQGRILFDVPTAAYNLRVSEEGGEPGQEKSALIEIPLRMEPEPMPQVLKEVPETAPPPRRRGGTRRSLRSLRGAISCQLAFRM
jgi:hypothetical protein